MSWIHIDAEHGVTIARVMMDSGHRSAALIGHLRSLAGVPGLGWTQGEVDAVVYDSAAAMERATTSYLEEGVDMMKRLLALLQEQAAASVLGQVMTPASILGATVVGGTAAIVGGVTSPTAVLGASIVGGTASVAAKSWAQGVQTHTDRFGNTYEVVYNPSAGAVLGAGNPGELRYTAAGQPYYAQWDPMAPTGQALTIPTRATDPGRIRSANDAALQVVINGMIPGMRDRIYATEQRIHETQFGFDFNSDGDIG